MNIPKNNGHPVKVGIADAYYYDVGQWILLILLLPSFEVVISFTLHICVISINKQCSFIGKNS